MLVRLTQTGLEGKFKKIMDSNPNTELKKLPGKDIEIELNKLGKGDNFQVFKEQALMAAEFQSQGRITVMYSTFPYHTSPLAINVASNTMLRYLGNTNKELRVTNHPLPADTSALKDLYQPQFNSFEDITSGFSKFVTLAVCLVTATFAVPPTEERICSVISHIHILLHSSNSNFTILVNEYW